MSEAQMPVSAIQAAPTAKKDVKKNLKYLRDKYREKVKGVFKYHEVPNGEMEFDFREFKEDPIVHYHFVDGGVYEIPLGVARHLNTNCWYPSYEFLPGEKGVQGVTHRVKGFVGHVQKITKKTHRCSFSSLEFLDIEDLPQPQSAVVTVETVPL